VRRCEVAILVLVGHHDRKLIRCERGSWLSLTKLNANLNRGEPCLNPLADFGEASLLAGVILRELAHVLKGVPDLVDGIVVLLFQEWIRLQNIASSCALGRPDLRHKLFAGSKG